MTGGRPHDRAMGAVEMREQARRALGMRAAPRTPRKAWAALAIVAAVILSILALACPTLDAAEPVTGPRVALYGWRQMTWDAEGAPVTEGGDLWGARAVASMPLKGGMLLGLRADASAMDSGFALESPSSWRTVEGYVALSWPRRVGPLTAGPAVMGGAVAPITTEATWAVEPALGGGLRFGAGRSWAYALAGTNKAADQRCPPEVPCAGAGRFMAVVHVEVSRFVIVGDAVTGPGGYQRLGIAFRMPVPWGAK